MNYKEVIAIILSYPIKLFNSYKIRSLYKELSSFTSDFETISDIGKTLVLAPHIDDETIGLGGLLCENKSLNKLVDLVYLTDSGSANSQYSDIHKLRVNEAKALVGMLNINSLKVLDIKSGEPIDTVVLSDRIMQILRDDPTYKSIFIVSPFDAHIEHRMCVDSFYIALKSMDFKGDIYFYEASNLLPSRWVNCIFTMDNAIMKQKEKLYAIFKSQYLMDFDIFQRLNIHKGLLFGNNQPMEHFSKMNRHQFLARMESIKSLQIENILPYRIGNNRSFYKVASNESNAQSYYRKTNI